MKPVWEKPLSTKGLGGVAATRDCVIVSDRELDDTLDAYKCLRASDGKELWTVRCPAAGNLDFGNSPRATPLIHGKHVYLFGAFGHLHCVELESGKSVWEMDVRETFGVADERKWGMCSSPLIVDGKLILNPGGKDASVVALEPLSGKVVWKCSGKPASYGSLMVATLGGKQQIVGFDSNSLGGWDAKDGKRIWRFVFDRRSEFNVPTPIQIGEQLLVAVENNGTFLFNFTEGGAIDPKPAAHYERLAPDTHTPVVAGKRVFGIWNGLHCLDLSQGLKPVWVSDDGSFGVYGSIVAAEDRILVTTLEGELILIDAAAERFRVLSRAHAFKDDHGVYSHPAFVGSTVYLRGSNSIVCLQLKP